MRVLIILAGLVLAGCGTFAPSQYDDPCGYTWFRIEAPARLVTVTIEPDTRRWPGICAEWRTWACTTWHYLTDGKGGMETWAEIRLAEPPGPASGCSAIEHEYKHAAGLNHREQYQPRARDHTR